MKSFAMKDGENFKRIIGIKIVSYLLVYTERFTIII